MIEGLPEIPKSNVNIGELKKKWSAMSYTELYFEWKVAANRGDVWASFVREAVEERRDGSRFGLWAIVRDAFRLAKAKRLDFDGGHWRRIRKKIKERPHGDAHDKWYKKPVGIVFLSVCGTTIALLIRAYLRHRFPGVIP